MSDTLGLLVAPDGITAVRLDAVAGSPATVIQLGTDGPAAVCAVAQDEGGGVVVGEAAAAAPGPTVTDPLERAAAGRIGALAAVVNHVVGRATTATGSAPRRLAVVVPDDWTATQRDRVVEAGAAAGMPETVVVPLTAALTQVGDADELVATATGAARVASLAAAPLVTREDLGETLSTRAPVIPPPSDPPTGPVSVFDEDPVGAPDPVRPSPAPVPSAPVSDTPPTQVVAAVPPPVEPLRYEPPSRRISGVVIAMVVLLGLIGAVGIALVAFDDPSSTDTDQTPASTAAPSTEAPPTTSEPAESTTTVDSAPSTTSTEPADTTTTSTTTEPPSTTTTPVAVGTPGIVTLVETGLQLEGGTLVLFDQSEEAVFAALRDVLGKPDTDSGLEESAFCLGARNRFVSWGDLEVVFTEEELDTGEVRFTQWYASGHDDPEGLVTISGVGVTATVGYLEVTLGGSLQLVAAIPGDPDDPAGLFAATNPGSGGILNGTTTSRDPEGIVTSLWAGDSCTRIFV